MCLRTDSTNGLGVKEKNTPRRVLEPNGFIVFRKDSSTLIDNDERMGMFSKMGPNLQRASDGGIAGALLGRGCEVGGVPTPDSTSVLLLSAEPNLFSGTEPK